MTSMLGTVRIHAVSRVAAALVAVALSGSMRLGAAEPGHGSTTHVCRCGAHRAQHVCSCPVGHRARAQEIAKLPRCHRAAARQEVARQEAQSYGACMKGSCGLPESPQTVGTRIAESYTLPDPPWPVVQQHSEELPVAREVAYGVTRDLDTPPPRIG